MMFDQLEKDHPEIYGPYPDNLAGRSWIVLLFRTSSDDENDARHKEWERRLAMAKTLHLVPPPPPNLLILKGG